MSTDNSSSQRQIRLAMGIAVTVLPVVAILGFILSFRPVWHAAQPIFGDPWAMLVPLMVDLSIAGAAAAYLASSLKGHRQQGWRVLGHAGVAATLTLNLLSSESAAEIPWHVAAPVLWSAIVELTASAFLSDARRRAGVLPERIPVGLWLVSPASTLRTWIHMRRAGIQDHVEARRAVRINDAALAMLRATAGGWSGRRVIRSISAQLRDGSLSPYAVLGPLGELRARHGARVPAQDVLEAIHAVVLSPGQSQLLISAAHKLPVSRKRPAAGAPAAVSDSVRITPAEPEETGSISLSAVAAEERLRHDADLAEWITEHWRSEGKWPSETEVHAQMKAMGDARSTRTAARIRDRVKSDHEAPAPEVMELVR